MPLKGLMGTVTGILTLVDPLEKLVAQKNKTIEQSSVEHKTLEQSSVKQNEISDSELDDTIQNAHEAFFETAGSDTEDDSDLYVKALKLNQPQYLDKIYFKYKRGYGTANQSLIPQG